MKITKKKVHTVNYEVKSFRCDMTYPSINGYKRILDRNEISMNNQNWDIYIPSGYRNVEKELKSLQVQNENQVILGIPGCDSIVSKRYLWKLLENKYGRKEASKIIPESFVLNNRKQFRLFKKIYNPEEIYILKSKKQRKTGLKLTKDINEIKSLRKEKYKIVQKYIPNPYLVNNRKVNLRMYLLLVIKDKKLYAYLSKYGECIYTNKEYNPNDFNFEHNITSYMLDYHNVYKDNPFTFNQLRTYIKENGGEPNILFDRINEIVKKMLYAAKDELGSKKLEKNLCFQIFGLDIIFDTNLKPYLLECNKGPDMTPRDYVRKYLTLVKESEQIHLEEEASEINKPRFYIHGDGLKVQRDAMDLLKIIKIENPCQGFYQIY